MTELEEDLAAMAADELDRALTLSWRELAAVAPWGDAYDGFSPAGRQVTVERSYLWSEESGGDILCEVFVYGVPIYIVLTLLVVYGRDPYRLGPGDSAARMALHVIPMVFFYFGLKFIPLLRATPAAPRCW